ncbi:MAG: ABC transporter substrate-binding protein [Alphaproteobacteria bacterium]
MTGAKAWMGEQYKWGVEMAVAEINSGGGLLEEKLRLIIGDDAWDAAQAGIGGEHAGQ